MGKPDDTDADGATDAAFAALNMKFGERVRLYRARRGMSRKVLSNLSGVSERYLAQLESGQANVSLHILWSLAQAMNVSIPALIEDPREDTGELARAKHLLETLDAKALSQAYGLLRKAFSAAPGRTGKVALIGLRGAGKTTLGQVLAKHYNVPFLRISTAVEETAGMALPEVLMTLGQKAYRQLEFGALEKAIARKRPVVIETGGSLVSEERSFELVLRSCFTVWIKASPQDHMRRVLDQGDLRPMEGDMDDAMEDLRTILASRGKDYGRAHLVLDTTGRSVEDCARDLIAACAPDLAGAMQEPA